MLKKQSITVDELCEGLPDGFKDIATYVRSMGICDEPNYDFIESKLFEIAEDHKINLPTDEAKHRFNWNFKPN